MALLEGFHFGDETFALLVEGFLVVDQLVDELLVALDRGFVVFLLGSEGVFEGLVGFFRGGDDLSTEGGDFGLEEGNGGRFFFEFEGQGDDLVGEFFGGESQQVFESADKSK